MTAPTCRDCTLPANGKYGGPCSKCGAPLCPEHAHFYTDESNVAVTASARPECSTCAGGTP